MLGLGAGFRAPFHSFTILFVFELLHCVTLNAWSTHRLVRSEAAEGAPLQAEDHNSFGAAAPSRSESEASNIFARELRSFHSEANSVTDERACACSRVNTQVSTKDLLRVTRPTIYTHVRDFGGWSDWTRDQLLQRYGNVTFNSHALAHNGAGFYLHERMGIEHTTLANILNMDQPGNLFVDEKAENLPRRMLGVHAQEAEQALNDRGRLFLSFGVKGQWNQVHRHGPSFFTQVQGSKGWVIAPPGTFPDADRRMHLRSGFTARHLTELVQEDVCGPFLAQHRHGEGTTAVFGSASQNLTDQGMCCTVHKGEGIFVPDGWWHGTCDLSEWTSGYAFFLT